MERKNSNLSRKKMNQFLIKRYKNDPFVKRIIDNAFKKQWIEKKILPNKKFTRTIVKLIGLISFISDYELKKFSKELYYKSIYNKVKKDFRDNSVNLELVKEYEKRIKPVIKKINYLVCCLEKKIYWNKYSQIKNLEKSNKANKEQLINKIKKPFLNNLKKQPLLKELAILKLKKKSICKFPYNVEDTKNNPTISNDKLRFQKYLAMKIYKPELFLYLFEHEEKFKKFPLNWLMHLTIPEIGFLYEEYKKGKLRTDYLKSEVSRENYLNSFFIETQELPFFKKRKRFIEQIIENHNKGKYASTINLILPQIEAFIWIIAAYLQKVRKIKIFRKAPIKNFWDFNLNRYKKIELIQTNDKIIKGKRNITIKNLVSKTLLNKFLHEAQIKFFVNELFEERNPIFHGNAIDYDSEVDSCKKIICLRYLIKQFIDKITDVEFKNK